MTLWMTAGTFTTAQSRDWQVITFPGIGIPEKKMATYVVEQEDNQGKKVRMNISISVSIGGVSATLTESEQEDLAKQAAGFLGYNFLGKA